MTILKKEKLRYAILKEIESNNLPLTEVDLDVTEDEFDDAVGFLSREKYLIGDFWAGDRAHLFKIGPSLTEKGENYLRENSAFAKTYKGAKEIREWFKL
ncbi:YjcQ family protein [Lysinibacillus sp. NPDC093712]|uniref:YjcQ family protein n=1 Tax=Lysinibacillus sp. NPDC093712 TaxID=3390579 RepID=UPI003CFBD749